MIVRSPARQGMPGSSATDGVVRRRRNTWPSAVEVKISGLDVVDGSVRIYVRSMVWRARQRAVRGGDEDSVLVAVVGWHRGGWWACCVGGAVVTFDMSGLGAAIGVGAALRTCTDVEGRKLRAWRVGAVD